MHGHYLLNGNGSITLIPNGDGFQQIQDPCAPVSNFLENYNNTELYVQWRIFLDSTTGGYKLHLFQFDGAPLAPQFQVSSTPTMLPKKSLRNVTATSGTTTTSGLTVQNALVNTNDASPFTRNMMGIVGVAIGAGIVGVLAVLV